MVRDACLLEVGKVAVELVGVFKQVVKAIGVVCIKNEARQIGGQGARVGCYGVLLAYAKNQCAYFGAGIGLNFRHKHDGAIAGKVGGGLRNPVLAAHGRHRQGDAQRLCQQARPRACCHHDLAGGQIRAVSQRYALGGAGLGGWLCCCVFFCFSCFCRLRSGSGCFALVDACHFAMQQLGTHARCAAQVGAGELVRVAIDFLLKKECHVKGFGLEPRRMLQGLRFIQLAVVDAVLGANLRQRLQAGMVRLGRYIQSA